MQIEKKGSCYIRLPFFVQENAHKPKSVFPRCADRCIQKMDVLQYNAERKQENRIHMTKDLAESAGIKSRERLAYL